MPAIAPGTSRLPEFWDLCNRLFFSAPTNIPSPRDVLVPADQGLKRRVLLELNRLLSPKPGERTIETLRWTPCPQGRLRADAVLAPRWSAARCVRRLCAQCCLTPRVSRARLQSPTNLPSLRRGLPRPTSRAGGGGIAACALHARDRGARRPARRMCSASTTRGHPLRAAPPGGSARTAPVSMYTSHLSMSARPRRPCVFPFR